MLNRVFNLPDRVRIIVLAVTIVVVLAVINI